MAGGVVGMLDKIKAYGFQALALALLALSIYLGFQLYEARLDAEKSRSALSAEQTSRARENTERMRVALDDARATFRKGEIHARNQQEIADAHAKQERARAAALAAAAADGERLRDQVRAFAAACVGEKPRLLPLPSAIAEIEPPPSGHYTKLLTDRRETSRQRLKSTPTKSVPSSGSSSTNGR